MSSLFLEVPILTAIVWVGVAAAPWAKGLRTGPERAFVAASLLVGLWALADWVFYHSRSADGSAEFLAARVRMSILVFVSLGFFYFGRWLARSRGIVDLLALVPVAGTLAIVWTVALRPVNYDSSGVPFLVRDPLWYAAYQVQVGGYGVIAAYYIRWTLRRATFTSEATRTRLASILWILVIGLGMWVGSNVYAALSPGPTSPVVTVFPLVLGALLLVGFFRLDPQRFRRMIRKLLVTPARPTIAILYHNSGSPLAQVVLPGGRGLDPSALSDLAEAVDHVLTTALRSDAGALRQLRHGDFHLLFERGKFVTLVVVLEGPPSEGLRSEMRTAVRQFEATHGDRLGTWETAAAFADKALAALNEVLVPSVL